MELPKVTQGQPHLAKQDLDALDINKLTPLSPEVISRQATINIGKGTIIISMFMFSSVETLLLGFTFVRFVHNFQVIFCFSRNIDKFK